MLNYRFREDTGGYIQTSPSAFPPTSRSDRTVREVERGKYTSTRDRNKSVKVCFFPGDNARCCMMHMTFFWLVTKRLMQGAVAAEWPGDVTMVLGAADWVAIGGSPETHVQPMHMDAHGHCTRTHLLLSPRPSLSSNRQHASLSSRPSNPILPMSEIMASVLNIAVNSNWESRWVHGDEIAIQHYRPCLDLLQAESFLSTISIPLPSSSPSLSPFPQRYSRRLR